MKTVCLRKKESTGLMSGKVKTEKAAGFINVKIFDDLHKSGLAEW